MRRFGGGFDVTPPLPTAGGKAAPSTSGEAGSDWREAGREKELFERALDIDSPEARISFVRESCAGDCRLEERLNALIAVAEGASGFLPGQPGVHPPTGSAGPALHSLFGRYELIERIGEGGFGIVYLAEQREPIRRQVALKIIKPGMDSKQVIGRFEAERQALALMDHPNIARIFDAGTTEQGHPYFVMELVRGLPITSYCEQHRLGIEARLELFIKVCQAVQHAHQKGIIHRDLKPTNVLVVRPEEQAVPKVIDFGIAKAIHQPLTEGTVWTQFHQFLGTPAYMSPEQAAANGGDVDTRSDIYSLGVLLYELLTGSPPFETKELLSAGLEEMRRAIRERDPERPSTRCGRMANATARGLDSSSARELDLIVLKALAKDRERRYATAHGLALDLRRYLSHEPVTAMPPSVGYQLAKFFRRHWKVATAVAFFGLLLAAFGVIAAGLAWRARQAEAAAAGEARTVAQVSEFLWKELLKPLTPWQHDMRTISLHEAFDLAASNIHSRLRETPLAEAAIRLSFGRVYVGLFDLEAAETNLVRALALNRQHAEPLDVRTAEILFQLATLRQFQNQIVEAGRLFAESAEIRSKLLGASHRDTLVASARASMCQALVLPDAEAEPILRENLEKLPRLLSPSHYLVVNTLVLLGRIEQRNGRSEKAFELFDRARQLAAEEGPASNGALTALSWMASVRSEQGRYAEAEDLWTELISARERVSGATHPFFQIAQIERIHYFLLPQGRFAEAARVLLKMAGGDQAGPPSVRPEVRQAIEELRATWQAKGGGPECEEFLRQSSAYLTPAAEHRP